MAVVVLAVMIAVLLIARPTHDAILTSPPPRPIRAETMPAALAVPAERGPRPDALPDPGVGREPRVTLVARPGETIRREGRAGPSPSRPAVFQRESGQSP